MIKKIKELFHIDKKETVKLTFEDKMTALFDSLVVDELGIFIGADLDKYGDSLVDDVWVLRKKIKNKTGVIIPPVKIVEREDIQENEYQILVREKVVFSGFVIPNDRFAKKEILHNLELICKEKIDDVISCETIQKYVNLVETKNKWLSTEVGNFFYITELKKILLDLVKNGCSIKDISFIFEQITQGMRTNSIDKLVENISEVLPKSKWDVDKKFNYN